MAERRAERRRLLVRGGTVVDATGERRRDVLVEAGRVVAVEASIDPPGGAFVLEADGCIVSPGLVDLHAHLREPGDEEAETVSSGARAGAVGGYTALVAMPNTDPPLDSAAVCRDVLALAEGACCEVCVAGAITIGRRGEQIAPMAELAGLGVRIFTDDGRGVQDPGVLRRALEYARDLGVVLAEHCEDEALSRGGHMHEGAWSSRLGVPAQPALAEEAMLARDLALVGLTGAPMHFLHLSSAASVALVATAKAAGAPVTAEVTPHHLCLTDAEVASYDPRFKVNPPLRTEADRAALVAACADGVVDAVATDHAPHTAAAKEASFAEAPSGVTGLETAYAVCYEALCRTPPATPALTAGELVAMLSTGPARIAGLDRHGQGGPIRPGAPAHLCVFDPEATWTVGERPSYSRSQNSPFLGAALTGRVRHTVYAGEAVVVDGEPQR